MIIASITWVLHKLHGHCNPHSEANNFINVESVLKEHGEIVLRFC